MNSTGIRAVWIGFVAALGASAALADGAAVAQLTPAQFDELKAKGDGSVLLVDVRTPEEYAAGHIPGAVNIPYDQVAKRLSEIPKDDEVVLYCHSGRRAGLAATTLEAEGYTKLAHLVGDMQGWTAAGLPVEVAAAKSGVEAPPPK
ncbi:MAG: rhodanese-like domain-containing protein [Steroidobacteraceae bacterium]